MKRSILISLLTWMYITGLFAQNIIIKGQVVDGNDRQPLEAAAVTLLQGEKETLINYTLTDSEGKFKIETSAQDILKVSVSHIGYKKQLITATTNRPMLFAMEQESIVLKEVQILSGRIWSKQDTIRYDLSRFTSSKDQYIKDVLKKLPGVNVEDNGQIKYNGKAISNFYVEGLDVTGGRYNQITNNLKADAVKTAEIIEQHQPIKALRKKVFTDNVALNLKLKPDANSQWLLDAAGGTGYGNDWLYTATANALQLDKKEQTIYSYKTNNTGKDLGHELEELTIGSSFNKANAKEAPQFLQQPYFQIPLNKQHTLFNGVHTLAANRLYKLNEERMLRFQLGYTHDRITQQRGSRDIYFFSKDTIQTYEQQEYRLYTDRANGELNFEKNSASSYTYDKLMLSGKWDNGSTHFSGDRELSQQIQNSRLEVKNDFTQLYTKENYNWGIHSFLRYSYLPAELQINKQNSVINTQSAYSDHSFFFLRKKNGLTSQLTSGIQGEFSSVLQEKRYKSDNYTVYGIPQLEWEKERFRTTFAVPVEWRYFPKHSLSKFYVNPSLGLRYQFNSKWKTYLYGQLQKSAGDLPDFYPKEYRQDYRTRIFQCGIIPEMKQQKYSLYVENKNTVQEFFWTLSLVYLHTNNNLIREKEYTNGEFLISSTPFQNNADSYTLTTIASKGIYDWNLKTSIELILNRSKGKQRNQQIVQSYQYNSLQCMPRIIWAPSSLLEASYEVKIGCNSSKIDTKTYLNTLWSVNQQLTLNFEFPYIKLLLTGEHYYNDLSKTQHLNTFLANASFIYKNKKWSLTAAIRNLLNKKQYTYTLYSDTESHTIWTNLRTRELLITAQREF